jgi:predicted Fe-S protein YdhL (DUF1289 family)
MTDEIKKSHCIKICKLDENNICIGCKRHVDEIKQAGIENKKKLINKIKEYENKRNN